MKKMSYRQMIRRLPQAFTGRYCDVDICKWPQFMLKSLVYDPTVTMWFLYGSCSPKTERFLVPNKLLRKANYILRRRKWQK